MKYTKLIRQIIKEEIAKILAENAPAKEKEKEIKPDVDEPKRERRRTIKPPKESPNTRPKAVKENGKIKDRIIDRYKKLKKKT